MITKEYDSKNKIKLLSIVPAIAMMITIFCFSAQNALESSNLSGGIVEGIFGLSERILQLELSTVERIIWLDVFETIVRKAAHMTEYALLAITVACPLYIYGSRNLKLVLWTEIICMIYAITDEIHQLYVPGRSGQITDVLIDSSGALLGCLLFLLIVRSLYSKR